MKKGISLIVLVITIIVLAILAGAIIISLSNTNIMTEASAAKKAADEANARSAIQLEYSAALARGKDGVKDGKAYTTAGVIMVEKDYQDALVKAGFSSTEAEKYTVTVDADGCPTKVAYTSGS